MIEKTSYGKYKKQYLNLLSPGRKLTQPEQIEASMLLSILTVFDLGSQYYGDNYKIFAANIVRRLILRGNKMIKLSEI